MTTADRLRKAQKAVGDAKYQAAQINSTLLEQIDMALLLAGDLITKAIAEVERA